MTRYNVLRSGGLNVMLVVTLSVGTMSHQPDPPPPFCLRSALGFSGQPSENIKTYNAKHSTQITAYLIIKPLAA